MPLKLVAPADVSTARENPVDKATLAAAQTIVDDVRARGEVGLRHYAEKFGEVGVGAPLVVGRAALKAAFTALPADDQAMLLRTADRIRAFADAQRASIREVTVPIPGGEAGQSVSPVDVAGCYAPGGRFPLPSSVLMTAITARAAGVSRVFVASPRPAAITLAAAHVAGADALLPVGGAQAIAAMAYGVAGVVPRCDTVVGPGSRWVTAAKKLVSGHVAIDMLAGPSELVVYADADANPAIVAADLLAQAEHDTDALPVLVTPSRALVDAVNAELDRQLAVLPTRSTAEVAVAAGFAVVVNSEDQAVDVLNELAPEHLELLCGDATLLAPRLRHYGGLFIGEGAAEVLGDYGAGPNHTLPTSGTARFTGGLSVFHFLRIRTWMRIDDRAESQELVRDAIRLARHEGLEGHARSAEMRAD